MANTDRARKLLVRSALATSATIATFVGAQNLAMLDTRQFLLPELAPVELTSVVTLETAAKAATAVTPVPTFAAPASPVPVIRLAAPSIIVLRPAQPNALPTAATTMVIQPPVPAVISVPQPVIAPPEPVIEAPQPVIAAPEQASAPSQSSAQQQPQVVQEPARQSSRSTR